MRQRKQMSPLFAESAGNSRRDSPSVNATIDPSKSNRPSPGHSSSAPTRETSVNDPIVPQRGTPTREESRSENPDRSGSLTNGTSTHDTLTNIPGRNRRPPREFTYEIMQAHPELISAFKDARAKYHEAILAWWHRKPRRKGETPTDEDWELVKQDLNVQQAGRELDAIDEQLTRTGQVMRVTTFKNDRNVQRQLRAEERQLDKDFYAHYPEERETSERPHKRRKVTGSRDGDSATGEEGDSRSPRSLPEAQDHTTASNDAHTVQKSGSLPLGGPQEVAPRRPTRSTTKLSA